MRLSPNDMITSDLSTRLPLATRYLPARRAPHTSCDDLVHGSLAICALTPIIGRIGEEIAIAPYTLQMHRIKLAGGERLTWRQGWVCFLKATSAAVLDGALVSLVVILTARALEAILLRL